MTVATKKRTKKTASGAAKPKAETVLVLRTCAADMTSHNGFVWPKSGPVECPDWRDDCRCGGGLHGLLWGEGDAAHLSEASDAKWLVVRVDVRDLRHGQGDMVGKCKFRRGIVVYCGVREEAVGYIASHGGQGKSIAYVTATAGYRGTATAGDGGTATAGDGGTATAGYRGTATAGDYGTATAGDGGTATAGDGGTATAGDGGTATAGDGGAIIIEYWDGDKYRKCIGVVGENGIQPNKKYHVANMKLAKVE